LPQIGANEKEMVSRSLRTDARSREESMGTSSDAAHAGQVLDVLAGVECANSALAASWRRSGCLHALDPTSRTASHRLSEAEVAVAQERLGRLLQLAQSGLERLFLAVGGAGCSVLMADHNGVVIARRGARADDTTFEAWGLWTGAVWSEKFEGTNGIGTCLVEKRPLTIDRDQHFFTRNSRLFCTTAPIFDEHGELRAALDVSSCRANLTEGFSKLIANAVADAARVIEAENFRQTFANARIVVTPNSEGAINSLLAVDRDDLVIGATRAARRALGLTAAALERPVPAADLIEHAQADGDNISTAERAVLLRALARSHGNVSKAAKELNLSRATLHRKINQLGLRH
jgi:transcriptional regulator of acetoin/glycerol metabolism